MSAKDKLIGTVVGAAAAVGVLGAGWAWAQEAPTTTTPPTTVAPGTSRTPAAPGTDGPRHCDHDGTGGSSSTDAPSSSSSSSQTNL